MLKLFCETKGVLVLKIDKVNLRTYLQIISSNKCSIKVDTAIKLEYCNCRVGNGEVVLVLEFCPNKNYVNRTKVMR